MLPGICQGHPIHGFTIGAISIGYLSSIPLLPTFTDYHAKYFAHELTKRCAPDSVEKLAGALVDAQVDLNPHQIR
jgi:hypothetical protein